MDNKINKIHVYGYPLPTPENALMEIQRKCTAYMGYLEQIKNVLPPSILFNTLLIISVSRENYLCLTFKILSANYQCKMVSLRKRYWASYREFRYETFPVESLNHL